MNTTARNLLSLLAPVLLLTFGFLALRAGILGNQGGPAITGILCLIIGSILLYWWLENMLYPPILRWFRQRRELQIELEQYRLDQEAYASWEDDDDNTAYGEQAYAEGAALLGEYTDEDEHYDPRPQYERSPSKLWLNIGYMGDNGKFVSLPVGLPLDNIQPLNGISSSKEFRDFQTARNEMLAVLLQAGDNLEPGEDLPVRMEVRISKSFDF